MAFIASTNRNNMRLSLIPPNITTKYLPEIISILFLTVNSCCGQSALTGNVKEAILTPPLEWKYALGGYGARMNRPAEAIHDDIKAKALVLNDGSKKYVIVTLDILGLPPNIRPMVIKKLAGTGWTKENILLLPSHAHTSLEMFALNNKNVFNMPAIGIFHSELMEFVVDKLASLIKETDRNLKSVKIGTGQVLLEGFNR
jgi:neutral ceramidase